MKTKFWNIAGVVTLLIVILALVQISIAMPDREMIIKSDMKQLSNMKYSNDLQKMEYPVNMIHSPDIRDSFEDLDVNRLRIIPDHKYFELEPGDNDAFTVKVKNIEDENVTIDVKIIHQSHSNLIVDTDWFTITPMSGEIKPGETMEFNVSVSIPETAERGRDYLQIAFTNDSYPSPFPDQYPDYINVLNIGINIWKPPVIQILTPYIDDTIEAGKEYDYEIKIRNTGSEAISFNPTLESHSDFGPYGMEKPVLNDEDITITSPDEIKPGETAIIKVHVEVPPDTKGYYYGSINLNIEDSDLNAWEEEVDLNFNIWKQPTEPFIKTFAVDRDMPVTINLRGDIFNSYYSQSNESSIVLPSFDVEITGPSGKLDDIIPTKVILDGSVDLGGYRDPWEIDNEEEYNERYRYIENTYTFNGSEGEWELSILPDNTDEFDYEIQIGE